ncbi:MarR family winged helix-turn-helix transcriptional regulator [Nocardia sp. NPDC051321]|uniref:MarR family winged helix-turn-helix transcriptional regulator n=1 Tax=Nocardia sp. NPDC051321 TaxID=3364323 RepID=UPI00378C2410
MSRETVEGLRAQVGHESQSLQAAVDSVDSAAAAVLGVNRTDLRCLEILLAGDATPSVLATALGLTSGSVTTMLDRLAKLDYVVRHPEPGDRRKVLVRITPEAAAKAWEIYGPIAEEGASDVGRYTADELRTVLDFLRSSRELQERHQSRISALPKGIRR